MPAATLIELEDLRFRWYPNGPEVLSIERFTVAVGERVFIQGASGSGKTTLLSLIGGVMTPQQGVVQVAGETVNAISGMHRDRFRAETIGFIFQMFNLIAYLSLTANVMLPCRFAPMRHQKALNRSADLEQEARRLLGQLGLDVDALAARPVAEMSVGQQQRVAAARALIGAPPLIIADEPTSALDSDTRQSFLDLLFQEVKAADATLLFVSHDASLQSRFDRTVQLNALNRAGQDRP